MRYTVQDISEVEGAPRPRRRPKPWVRFLRLALLNRFKGDYYGATAVEFALISPIMIVMIGGIINYGSYFWTSHAVQQMANDAARAAIAGSTASERLTLAQSLFTSQQSTYSSMTPGTMALSMEEQSHSYVVTITFVPIDDGFNLIGTLPGMPSTIVRKAAVVRGGY